MRRVLSCLFVAIFIFLAVSCVELKANDYFYATVNDVPEFDGITPYVEINGNQPNFNKDYLNTHSFENYSELDGKGRCSVAIACVGKDLMPTEERGSIGMIRPSGWKTVRYDLVDGKYLYNRCHLIGYQLTGENANERNLITGTRYLNMEGMLPFEDMVAEYINDTNNHVLYRVTPVFDEDCLVARGVQIEAFSVEDNGNGIKFNIYAYNNQPGISINYYTGDSVIGDGIKFDKPIVSEITYIINLNSEKFHLSDCQSVNKINENNKEETTETREKLISKGLTPCKICNP